MVTVRVVHPLDIDVTAQSVVVANAVITYLLKGILVTGAKRTILVEAMLVMSIIARYVMRLMRLNLRPWLAISRQTAQVITQVGGMYANTAVATTMKVIVLITVLIVKRPIVIV
jgi:hypothetical protein